jgi:hypothetical protein
MITSVTNPPPMYMISLLVEIGRGPFLVVANAPRRQEHKKADVAEHPKAFDHVGLLTNEPPGTAGLLFI